MDNQVKEIQSRVESESVFVQEVMDQVGRAVVGQRTMIEGLLLGLLTGGHILLEGVPGLAKTLAVRSLAASLGTDFQRIQFTPDLLPADLLGTLIFDQKRGEFTVKKGPIFSHVILADEINRAPAKVQSALLESMQELQVTLGETTYKLEEPFLVLATQNPIEQEGTYPLPEAQVDRFMLKILVDYPKRDEERRIMDLMVGADPPQIQPVLQREQLLKARELVQTIYLDDKIKEYILDIVRASRDPKEYNLSLSALISYGASPRASIYLARAAKAHAFLRGRGFVTPEDVKTVGPSVLRHRISVSYEAEAEELTSEDIVRSLFDHIEVP
ncbi:MAG TPA: AAA family ATPase [Candidatus Krumholzibacteria bacterium]|nr:AAA family ATPase [Candidatus Krumholzibacteria bacterium]